MIDKKDAGLIAQDIRLAKDKEEQIRIEAQLYATDTTEIRRIAYEAGAYKVGPAEVKRALEILQQGGKNHTLGTLRLWMAAFKNCSSKDVKRILRDYRQKPWADPIPDEEFRKALDKDKEEEERDMAAEVTKETPEPKKEEKASVAQGFSQEETKLILYGLTGLFTEKEAEWRKLKKEAEEKLQKLEAAQRHYNNAKERADMAAAAMDELEQLIGRLTAPEQTENEKFPDGEAWAILSGEK